MKITVNGKAHETAAATLAALIDELGYGDETIGTARNRAFVRAADRRQTPIKDGDEIEVLTPRQGG
jgi:sulfur carrier protein